MLFLITSLVASVTNLFLGFFVYFRNPQRLTNRYFILLSASIVGWIITLFLYYFISQHKPLVFIGRLNYAISLPMTYFFLNLVLNFPKVTISLPKVISRLNAFFTFAVVILSLTTSLIGKDEIARGTERIAVYGDLYILWAVVFFGNLILALILLGVKIKKSHGLVRIQLLYLLIGFLLFILVGATTNVIIPYFNNYSFQQFGPLSTIFFIGFTTYAMVKHRLMNIRIILAKSIAYVFLIFLIVGFYISIMIWIGHTVFGIQIDLNVTIYYALLTIFAAFSFNPIKKFITLKTERLFYKKPYSSNQLLAELSTVLATNFGIEGMTTQTLTEITGEMKISKGAFYVYGRDNNLLPSYSVGYKDTELLDEQTVKHLSKLEKTILIQEDQDEGDLKNTLVEHDIFILSILKIQGKATGILVFSEKLTGQAYTEEDIEIIEIFSSEVAIALENAKAYEEIRNFNIDLERKIAEATADLRHANSKLRELDKVKDEFISITSHELRTPLGIIRGYLWMIMQNAKKIPKDLQEDVHIAIESTEHLIALVNDMLDVSRIEMKRMSLNAEKVIMKDVIDAVSAELLPLAKDKGIVLHSKCGKVPEFTSDKGKIHQILINLAGNAIKFTPNKGTVSIEAFEENKSVIMKVTDTGIGIKKEDQDKLFTKFGRLDTSYTAVSKTVGTGLGLYITKKMIDMLKGKISFESEFGKGTTFIVSFPVK